MFCAKKVMKLPDLTVGALQKGKGAYSYFMLEKKNALFYLPHSYCIPYRQHTGTWRKTGAFTRHRREASTEYEPCWLGNSLT
jgi:hypothetical protein